MHIAVTARAIVQESPVKWAQSAPLIWRPDRPITTADGCMQGSIDDSFTIAPVEYSQPVLGCPDSRRGTGGRNVRTIYSFLADDLVRRDGADRHRPRRRVHRPGL